MMIGLIVSCKQGQNTEVISGDDEVEFKAEELPDRISVNKRSIEVLKNWEEYTAFDNGFDAIYNSSNNEDLILVVEDLIDKQKLWEESDYPESFDKAQIKSRQKVLKTYILKLKSALDSREEFIAPTIELIEAYNAVRAQFNVLMNSQLDPKLLSDEQ